jgi:WD40 repeat protein
MTFSPDGQILATGGGWGDTTVKLWDVAQRQELLPPLQGHRGYIVNLAFTPDGKTLASTSDDSMVKLWNIATHQELASFEGCAMAISPDGNTLVTGGYDGMVRVWPAATFAETDGKGVRR